MDKKGLHFRIVVTLVVTLLVLAIMLLFYHDFGQHTYDVAKREQCKNSVRANAMRIEAMGDDLRNSLGERVQVNCRTEYKKVKKGEENETVANEMAKCWDMYLQGEKQLFDTTDNNYCVVCSVLKFETDEVRGFSKYLMQENLPWNSSLSYYDYLYGKKYSSEGLLEYENSVLKRYDKLDTEKPLAVVFFMGKNAYPLSKMGYEGGKISGTVTGTAIGIAGGMGLAAIGIVTGGAGLVAGTAIITASGTGGAWYGYSIGSSESAYWDSGILLHPYNKFDELNCTYIEGSAKGLDVKNDTVDFDEVDFVR